MRRSAPRVAVVLTAACVTLSPLAARASEDGGGRSVWALGAGNRALSLGGAYAAIANDASAPLWNPAGLANVTRSELQASHASLYSLGFDEQYASVVLPSWRLGSAAITFRHFGVSGIERRDDRNVLLDDDLSDHQTQLSLSYGRAMGPAWTLGGSLKLQTESLAGVSASGVGMDLGVMVRPFEALGSTSPNARRFSMGLALRNMLQPKLRLDEDTVNDPAGVRLGMGYWLPMGVQRTVLAALDFEKTSNMDTRVHAGLEIRPHPAFALRTGLNDGRFTAGTGVEWRGVDVNYAYGDNPIEATHRVGMSFRFGQTTAERRRAALEAQEDALQQRLAQAFEQRQQARITELVDTVKVAQERGDHETAMEQIAILRALQPDNQQIRALEAETLRARGSELEAEGNFAEAAISYGRALSVDPEDTLAAAGVQRCRAESDRIAQRTEQVRQQFAESLDAFTQGELVTARTGFEAILAEQPDDEEAAGMLRRTELAIDQRVDNLMSQAQRLIEWEQLDAAQAQLDAVVELDPQASGLARVRRDMERTRTVLAARARSEKALEAEREKALAEQAVAAPDEAPTAVAVQEDDQVRVLTPDELRQLEELYKRGLRSMEAGDSNEALHYLELVWSKSPEYQDVVELLGREYLMRGMEFFASGRVNDAVVMWEDALRVDPTDQRAIGYLARARQQLARTREILGEAR